MATLHSSKLVPTGTITATDSQAGYPPVNLSSEALGLPWRSTSAGAKEVILPWLAVQTIQTLFLHDVNFATCTVQKSVDGVAWVAVGVLTTYADQHGRRRGQITINAAGQLALRIQIGAATPLDGLGYWRIGAAHVFGAVATLPVGPKYGYQERVKKAQLAVELPNNAMAVARTGPRRAVIEISIERKFDQSMEDLLSKAEAGTVLLSLDFPEWPAQAWPVRYIEQEAVENYFKVHKAQRALVFHEVI